MAQRKPSWPRGTKPSAAPRLGGGGVVQAALWILNSSLLRGHSRGSGRGRGSPKLGASLARHPSPRRLRESGSGPCIIWRQRGAITKSRPPLAPLRVAPFVPPRNCFAERGRGSACLAAGAHLPLQGFAQPTGGSSLRRSERSSSESPVRRRTL